MATVSSQLSADRPAGNVSYALLARRPVSRVYVPPPEEAPVRLSKADAAAFVSSKLQMASSWVDGALNEAPCMGVPLRRGRQERLRQIASELELIAAEVEAEGGPHVA